MSFTDLPFVITRGNNTEEKWHWGQNVFCRNQFEGILTKDGQVLCEFQNETFSEIG